MGLTLVEKIISEHAGKQVHAGELVISKVDVSAVQDGTGPLTVQEFKKLAQSRHLLNLGLPPHHRSSSSGFLIRVFLIYSLLFLMMSFFLSIHRPNQYLAKYVQS